MTTTSKKQENMAITYATMELASVSSDSNPDVRFWLALDGDTLGLPQGSFHPMMRSLVDIGWVIRRGHNIYQLVRPAEQ